MEEGKLPKPLVALAQHLQHMARADSSSSASATGLHWRYSLMGGILQAR